MVKQPAVVIIARHGARLDAAHNDWHLSTPTPYDPPLTYGGWNQCRALGQRIEGLLQARENSLNDLTNEPPTPVSVKARDFAVPGLPNGSEGGTSQPRKRKRGHKVVIHSSPFTRCLQTSVAIAAGMSAYQPTIDARPRTPGSMHSASPRMRAQETSGLSTLAGLPSISEPQRDLAHEMARKRHLEEHKLQAITASKRHRKTKLRVDAFLGEWLNPSYFENILPPPPSNLMVAAAKGELKQDESIDVYTPTVSTPQSMATSSLWGGGRSGRSVSSSSRDSTLDGLSELAEQLPPPQQGRRSRHNSLESDGSAGGRIQVTGMRRGARGSDSSSRSGLQPLAQLQQPKQQQQQNYVPYVPPNPNWAISPSDHIPRGYVAHAREACANVDFQWDSSRPPQNWGDGGEYGEEWSSMHRRFRRGLNFLVHWYAQHNADDRGEDALGIEQADRYDERNEEDDDDDDEEDDLVVVLVTHGAGCNALIGALTAQPVLLDVGMASLTMAVRRPTAPRTLPQYADQANGFTHRRRGSLDLGLSEVYEMKIVAEHRGYDEKSLFLLELGSVGCAKGRRRAGGAQKRRQFSSRTPR